MLKVVIIGSGNVAHHLVSVFLQSPDVEILQAFARNKTAFGELLPKDKITTSFQDLTDKADIYIIAVTDDAIEAVSTSLPFKDKLVVHTSGGVTISQLDSKNRRGVFYPLQTFSKDKKVDFSTIPICLETENEADYVIVKQLANSISDNVYSISSRQRKALHVAAVFSSNFVNYMYTIGNAICNDNDIPFDILKPLILETADKVKYMSPLRAQTGPAIRNNTKTIESHLAFITKPNQREIYSLLTQSIQQENGRKL